MKGVHYEETKYGFEFGSAVIERTTSFEDGRVVLSIKTPKTNRYGVQICVTKTGKIRVFSDSGKEMVVKE